MEYLHTSMENVLLNAAHSIYKKSPERLLSNANVCTHQSDKRTKLAYSFSLNDADIILTLP